MSTNFPVALDALTNPAGGDALTGHASQHANANDAIEALQAKVGINSSADTNSLDYKINHLTKGQVGLGNVDNTSDINKPVSTAQAAADSAVQTAAASDATTKANAAQAAAIAASIPLSQKGAANGVAPLDGTGKVSSTYLPSYVDDVVESATYAALPATGETGKIYVVIADETHSGATTQYRWTGSAYAIITSSPGSTDAVPEGSTNLYFTAQRVRDAVLTGLSTATNAVIAATDSVLTALGKLQAQITALGSAKQDALVSGTNIKTLNGNSILGSGNLSLGSGATLGTAVNSTSGTSIDFTSIPAGVNRITVMLNAVSTNGSAVMQAQIGAGSIVSSGYVCTSQAVLNSNVTGVSSQTTGCVLGLTGSSSSSVYGVFVFTRLTGNTWTFVFNGTDAAVGPRALMSVGSITLSGTLDRVRITANGTDTFDAGSINILYE